MSDQRLTINVLGAGPGGLYAALLLKKAHPDWTISVAERNPPGATYGWGVVFSDQTLASFREADEPSFTEITDSFVTWDAIDIYLGDQLARCGGHRFAGLARRHLLDILARRCAELGVPVHFQTEIDDIAALTQADLLIAADGVNSKTRAAFAEHFQPSLTEGSTRFIWFGTDMLLDSFTFVFRENEHGLFTVHAYPFDGTTGTFIVECGEQTWRRAGLDQADEAGSLAYCQKLFADRLRGCRLMSNYSRWLRFTTVKNARWWHQNVVLLGDAAHTAHFSIGSGTKLAMEDAIALAQAFKRTGTIYRTHTMIEEGLTQFELTRKPRVEALQRAAAESQEYFEHVARYRHFAPIQFALHLLTRSGRITHDNLRQRDPDFVSQADRWFTESADEELTFERSNVQTAWPERGEGFKRFLAPPPMWAPLALRGAVLKNRIALSARPAYSASDGVPGDELAASLLECARGGAGLVVTEPVAVAPEGRITPGCAGMYCPDHASAWARVVAAIHDQSAARVALQLSHAGRRGATRPRTRGTDIPLREGAWPLIAASLVPYTPSSQTPRAMDCADMQRMREAFVQAVRMAEQAGFDMLLLNAAQGYLLSSFLSPLTNRREDGYGGTLEQRLRFPLEIYDAVRAAWPEQRPIGVAINASDWARGGIEIDDAITIARALTSRGCDLIAVCAGQTTPHAQPNYDPSTLAQYSDLLRNETGARTLATGYLTSTDQVNTLLAGGRADLCMFYPKE
ncbi:MAG TPA: FAD-dependent monooxygenase [Roseiflexaceae bacterium]|nr:FAD-dependent monooxygenase [Roseiflexaceae bacterium]